MRPATAALRAPEVALLEPGYGGSNVCEVEVVSFIVESVTFGMVVTAVDKEPSATKLIGCYNDIQSLPNTATKHQSPGSGPTIAAAGSILTALRYQMLGHPHVGSSCW